jgi:solute carrier family 34 (sodium-dependent phosphate cotransporter)
MRDRLWIKITLLALALWLFLFSVNLLGFSSRSLGSVFAEQLINVTSNPFIALFIGLLSTAIIQSSSTVTSMTVALVGAGTLSFSGAIPVILGANIGTCITSTLVALAHITSRSQFQRAFATGTAHDLFNLLATAILFPLEYYFKILSKPAGAIAGIIDKGTPGTSGIEIDYFPTFEKVSELILSLLKGQAWLALILAVVLLFISIRYISKLIRQLFVHERQKQFEKNFFGNKYKSLGWGALSTSLVQSSSITSSLTVPLVATERVSLKKAIPFILGTNIGTTITALIASFNQSLEAKQIAFVHLFFNLFAVILFFPGSPLGKIHSYLAGKLGELVKRERLIGFLYVLFVFFLLPFILIFLSGGLDFNRL